MIEFASQGANTSIDSIVANQRGFLVPAVAGFRSEGQTSAVVVTVYGNRFAKEADVFLRA